ncbi:MAG: hypothetical protein J0M12_17330 [Deltaproteobacteria bacterium]|nr:hypothetical protein [Deltaproteobacteria bacterium]
MDSVIERTKRIIEVLQTLVEQASEDGSALAQGKINEFNQRYESALCFYSSLSKNSNDYGEAQIRIAATLIKLGSFEQALEVASLAAEFCGYREFRSLTAGEPISAFTLLGDAQFRCGLMKQAEKSYSQAFEANKADTHSVAQMARIRMDAGDLENARKWAELIVPGQRYDDFRSAIVGIGGSGSSLGYSILARSGPSLPA